MGYMRFSLLKMVSSSSSDSNFFSKTNSLIVLPGCKFIFEVIQELSKHSH